MPATDLLLPNQELVRFVYLARLPNLGAFIYLQSKRSGRLSPASPIIALYKAMERIYAAQLAASLKADNAAYDAVVSPPSSSADADPYRAAANPANLPDLTSGFSRRGNVRAATASSLPALVADFSYAPRGIETTVASLLIADESLASGSTVVAVLEHLRRHGLDPTCKITVAAPAWLA